MNEMKTPIHADRVSVHWFYNRETLEFFLFLWNMKEWSLLIGDAAKATKLEWFSEVSSPTDFTQQELQVVRQMRQYNFTEFASVLRAYRSCTGDGLREAKEHCVAMLKRLEKMQDMQAYSILCSLEN